MPPEIRAVLAFIIIIILALAAQAAINALCDKLIRYLERKANEDSR